MNSPTILGAQTISVRVTLIYMIQLLCNFSIFVHISSQTVNEQEQTFIFVHTCLLAFT